MQLLPATYSCWSHPSGGEALKRYLNRWRKRKPKIGQEGWTELEGFPSEWDRNDIILGQNPMADTLFLNLVNDPLLLHADGEFPGLQSLCC